MEEDYDVTDDLFNGDLDKLEQQAVELTQRQQTQQQVISLADREYPVLRETLRSPADISQLQSDEIINLDRSHLPIIRKQAAPRVTAVSRLQTDEVTQREQWRRHRYGDASSSIANAAYLPLTRSPVGRNTSHEFGHDQDRDGGRGCTSFQRHKTGEEDTRKTTYECAELHARVLELEHERGLLQQAAEEARGHATRKAGEIAIVRANFEKLSKEHEQRLATIRQAHTDELARKSFELDGARKARERVETSNRFLEHDLVQELDRSRYTYRASRSGLKDFADQEKHRSPATTPKKVAKSIPFRDGFDDEEVLNLSPSKSQERSKTNTPRAGAKRKRSELPLSPAKPLELEDSGLQAVEHDSCNVSRHTPSFTLAASRHSAADDKYKFIEAVFNRKAPMREDRTMEFLAQWSLSSFKDISFSALIQDSLWPTPNNESVETLQNRLCNTILVIWTGCLEEKLYPPLYEIHDLMQFIFVISATAPASEVVSGTVSLCQKTSDLIAIPTAKALSNSSYTESLSAELTAAVDPLHYLTLLHVLANRCDEAGETARAVFWSAMQYDFVLLILHKAQPPENISLMLGILCTSVLQYSFGAISVNVESSAIVDVLQHRSETSLIDRLTTLLSDRLTFKVEDLKNSAAMFDKLQALRLDVLQVLSFINSSSHGGQALATHSYVIARLSAFLYENVMNLYSYREITHAQSVTIVNETVTLLAHLVETHRDSIDVRTRLNILPGASHKHLVALSRVAFAEGSTSLEYGIKRNVVDWAHRMLDEHLSPEEGEAVVECFVNE